LGKERRGWKGGTQAAADSGLMVFNGETLSRLDTAPRGGEPEGAWSGVEAEAARNDWVPESSTTVAVVKDGGSATS
jgi:hypothetical protein